MKKCLPLLTLIAVSTMVSCRSTAYIQEHGSEPVPCRTKDNAFLKCHSCKGDAYKGDIVPVTVSQLIAQRDTTKSNFFMFFDSGCHGFPTTMPPYLEKVQRIDSITPVLVVVDDYSNLPVVRKRVTAWGWDGPVHVLDQDHYGCYRFFPSTRDSLVLLEFNIQEGKCYHCTVSLEIMTDKHGRVTGYSNWNDLPGELRGKNIPKY